MNIATIRSPSGAKGSVDSYFNSSASERAFPSKLVPFELGDVTRSENIQASWNTPSPAQPTNPSPQRGPINGILPRRDSESSARPRLHQPCQTFHPSMIKNCRLPPIIGTRFLFLEKGVSVQSTRGRGKTLKLPLNGWRIKAWRSDSFHSSSLLRLSKAKKFDQFNAVVPFLDNQMKE
uniref:Uncharacterized protein n=1 Tax=Daphnia galeata TaxID=27404 RepID=A0A8J2SA23_9CRUS|nr:unnamed protein product [Daphnia galeata]